MKRYCVMVAQQTLTLFVWVQILVPLPTDRAWGRCSFSGRTLLLLALFLCCCFERFFEVWLSLVERYVRDVEAAGSNPVTSTKMT